MFVGIDLHKSTFNAAVVDDDGNLLRETSGKCEPDELRRFWFSESLPKDPP
jgi:predicted NBD/HSP70 family sugar kinase